MKQISLFPNEDNRSPETVTWNLWSGCTKVSAGCAHCYMYRKFEAVGRDPYVVRKSGSFNLPVRKLRAGKYKGLYRIPSGSHFYTCFSSDFFHPDADEWRETAWEMMKERSDCTFFMITKRPENIADRLPSDWGDGYRHVSIAVTCENQQAADARLPVYLSLPLFNRSVMTEPLLGPIDLRKYLATGKINSVSAGGESGPEARVCDYEWVLNLHRQCKEFGAGFYYHQTGARLLKDGKEYFIPRSEQHSQAHKAGLDMVPSSATQ